MQPHAETRVRQIAAWKALIIEYAKAAKLSIVDIGEASNLPLFYNTAIDRKVDNDTIQLLLIELQKTGNASPVDKQKHRWEIYWHTLEEWSSIIYNYITENNLVNSVLTLFELTQGETSLNLGTSNFYLLHLVLTLCDCFRVLWFRHRDIY